MKYFIICNKLNGAKKSQNALIYLKVLNMNYTDYIYKHDYTQKCGGHY